MIRYSVGVVGILFLWSVLGLQVGCGSHSITIDGANEVSLPEAAPGVDGGLNDKRNEHDTTPRDLNCDSPCSKGLTCCGGTCVDLRSHQEHCGRCGSLCPREKWLDCWNGSCLPSCTGLQTRCNGKCVHLGSDKEHCGACGKACPRKERCFKGRCIQCEDDWDCSSRAYCEKGRCYFRTCRLHTDCPDKQACDEESSTCVHLPSSFFGVGNACSQFERCGWGLVCLQMSEWETSHCFKNCKKEEDCLSGMSCIPVSSQLSVCGKRGKVGDLCDYRSIHKQVFCGLTQTQPAYCSPRSRKCTAYKLLDKEGADCLKGQKGQKDPFPLCDARQDLKCVGSQCKKFYYSNAFGFCGGGTRYTCRENTNPRLVCVPTSSQSGHCFPQCELKSPKCPQGTTCTSLPTGGTLGICKPLGVLGYGALCRTPTEPYSSSNSCTSSLACTNFGVFLCMEVFQGSCGQYSCKTKNTKCVDLAAGTQHANRFVGCLLPCLKEVDCPGHTYCRQLSGVGRYCWPKPAPGTQLDGQACVLQATKKEERCKFPRSCIATSSKMGVCGVSCSSNKDCPSVSVKGKNVSSICSQALGHVCVLPCQVNSDPCLQGTSCQSYKGQKLCAAVLPVGPNSFYATCNAMLPVPKAGCQKGLECVKTSSNGTGFCSRKCTNQADCTKQGFSPACQTKWLQDPKEGLCVLPCQPGSKVCPSHLQCQNLGNGALCIP